MKIYFSVEKLRPDQRQYRQTELELVPFLPLTVGVEVSDDLVEATVKTDFGELTMLTLEGLREIVSQCDLVFMGTSRSNKQQYDEDEPSDEEFGK